MTLPRATEQSLDALLGAAEQWRRHDPDPQTREELGRLIAARDQAELATRLSGPLAFGTSGLRGVLGAGPARMNRAVVRQATAGLARYLLSAVPDARKRGVVVGCDARHGSDVFAEDVAAVLAAQEIPALVFPELASTPLVAFAVPRLGAAAGVMITASHNARDYNGFKVWWAHGAQIVPPHDAAIAREMASAGHADAIALLERAQARPRGLWCDVSQEMEAAYRVWLAGIPLHAGLGRDLRIVYTPLHGVGGRWVPAALAAAGFGCVEVVSEQAQPDAAFPTISSPNPEEPAALERALALAEREAADLVLANDPDADRLAVAARDADGRLRVLTGNEIGALLGHQRLSHAARGPKRPLVMTTIVSSPLLAAIAAGQGALCEETLTGFKWIANGALALERDADASFVFGYEEALGFSIGTAVRDKDGISAALAVADLAGWCRTQGTTLLGRLDGIERELGVYLSSQRSLSSGTLGAADPMARVRGRLPERLRGVAVRAVKDYLAGVARTPAGAQPLTLPRADVLAFELEDGSRISLRPSGTEAKLKIYVDVIEALRPGEGVAEARERGNARLSALADAAVALVGDS